jgi:hypothetical protein
MTVERDDLELIPRSVRDKLDRAGIKLHLRDWQKLSLNERRGLVEEPCESSDEVDHYRRSLEDLIRQRTGSAPEYLSRRS